MAKIFGTLAAFAVVGLAVSAAPAEAQHRSGANVGVSHAHNSHNHRIRHFFPKVPFGFGLPYWNDNGWSYGPDYNANHGTTCTDMHVACASAIGLRWDQDNHSSTVGRGRYLAGQPAAAITAVASHEDSERDRAWLKRCEPRLAFDDNGVQRYHYNGKPGCASGQWSDSANLLAKSMSE